ncbi:MAG: hypothetical protein ABSA09_08360 [Desulfobaccales bacterium]
MIAIMRKRPKTQEKVSRSKRANSEALPDVRRQYPSWQVSLLQMVDPGGWHDLEKPKAAEIKEKLAEFEKKTWNTILVTEKHRNHTIAVGDLSSEAQERLAEIGQDDVDRVVSLRLSGQERIFGILDMAVLKLLWWDPNHQLCAAPKRHT